MKTLSFHLDFLSPYSYLAWTQIDRVASKYDRVVDPIPVVFAAMLDAFGTIGPAEVPIKRPYVYLDAHRKAALLGVPLRLPPSHPFPPLMALRAATTFVDREQRVRAVSALFAAAWGDGAGVDTEERVKVALDRAGLDGAAAIAAASQPETKQALMRATSEAIAAGVFGVPTMVVDGEKFWGLDSFPSLEAFLEGRDPVGDELRAAVRAVPIGIERKRK
jgi:2-hydroxychromene-2-carboxylate isomerase